MGMLFKLLLTKVLPARLAWIVAAFVLARAVVGHRESARVMPHAPSKAGRGS